MEKALGIWQRSSCSMLVPARSCCGKPQLPKKEHTLLTCTITTRHCGPQRNSYIVEIRTGGSICQCMGPLKGPANLMSAHSLCCTLTFSQQYEVTYEEKDIYIIMPLFGEQNGLPHVSASVWYDDL
ncbi:hypothetical protein NQZ68_022106 [Dissostichus eleginoides]|nr:hypothetical protein NQZ68_022106 [Dissostichus eleginoides]